MGKDKQKDKSNPQDEDEVADFDLEEFDEDINSPDPLLQKELLGNPENLKVSTISFKVMQRT